MRLLDSLVVDAFRVFRSVFQSLLKKQILYAVIISSSSIRREGWVEVSLCPSVKMDGNST